MRRNRLWLGGGLIVFERFVLQINFESIFIEGIDGA